MTNDSKFNLLKNFENYLIKEGYSKLTPSGHPSTVYDYGKRVNTICKKEAISIKNLSENIDFYVGKYDEFGSAAQFGNKSHRAYINALKRFRDFVNSLI